MRRLGIGRHNNNKRLRITEGDNGAGADQESLGSASSQFEIFHSTAIGTPSKRIALGNPLDSDEEILAPSPTPSPILTTGTLRSQNENLNPSRQQERIVEANAPIVITAPTGCPEFSFVLQQCGFILSAPPGRNHLRLEELVFRKKLGDWVEDKLKEEPEGPNNPGRKFIRSMRTFLSVSKNLIQSMTPTLFYYSEHQSLCYFQSTLLHNLLCLPIMQDHVFEVLFPMLIDSALLASNQETVNTFVSIINQIRWLPNIVKEEYFITTILDLVVSSTPAARKQLILNLPEIIPESKHFRILEVLRKLLDRPDNTLPAILDCLSTLYIPANDLITIRETALKQMFSSSLADYPAFFSFLFAGDVDSSLVSETITCMREKLEITPLGQDAKCNVHMIEIVEKIRFCCGVNNHLLPVWVKQVKDDLEANEEIRPIDLIMLLIFCQFPQPPHAVLKLMFSNEKLSMKLLNDVLKNNLPIVNHVYKKTVDLCISVLRGKDTKAYPVMEYTLVKLFVSLSVLEAQVIALDLTNMLLEQIFPSSREAALRTLIEIAIEDGAKLLVFNGFLMHVLEFIHKFPMAQIKLLMRLLAILAHVENCKNSFASEFSILLRKQLTSSNKVTRGYGVLGALASVKQLSEIETNLEENQEKIRELLDLVWSFVQADEEACIMFFDEFSEIAHSIPRQICKEYQQVMASKFQEMWTTDKPLKNKNKGVQLSKPDLRLSESFDANRELDKEDLFITFEEGSFGMRSLVVPSHLRLIGQLVSALEKGDLTMIDAILGSPVLLPDMDYYYKDPRKLASCTHDQKIKLGRYLVLGINFFRESVSVYIDMADPDLRIKIWLRLSNITFLQQILVKHFSEFPILPCAYGAENDTCKPNHFGSSSSKGRKKKVVLPNPKISKTKTVNTSRSKTVNAKTEKTQKNGKPAKTSDNKKKKDLNCTDKAEVGSGSGKLKNVPLENLIQPKSIVPHLRRFDTKVFSILLKSPLNDGSEIDFSAVAKDIATAPSQKLIEMAKFTPETLVLILTEIIQQTNNSKIPFNILHISHIVDSLCSHLDTIATIYASGSLTLPDENRFESCFRLLFKTFSLVLETIQKEKEADQKELFQKIVTKIVKRLDPASYRTAEFSEIVQKSAAYFTDFSKIIKTPATAVQYLLLLKQFDDLDKDKHLFAQIVVKISKMYLRRNWKLSCSQVEVFLKAFLAKAETPLTELQSITQKLAPNDGKAAYDTLPCKEYYKSCSLANFHTWYSAILSTLANHVYKEGKRLKAASGDEIHTFWNMAILILKDLVIVTNDLRKNLYLIPLVKYSRKFFEALCNHGIKKLPLLINRDIHEAKMFIKNVQTVTRKVQIICEHSKVIRDTSLLKFVPGMRKALEVLVFRVREALAGCGGASAFELGNLRHKDMNGVLMNSQPFNNPQRNSNLEFSDEDDDDDDEKENEDGGSDTEVESGFDLVGDEADEVDLVSDLEINDEANADDNDNTELSANESEVLDIEADEEES